MDCWDKVEKALQSIRSMPIKQRTRSIIRIKNFAKGNERQLPKTRLLTANPYCSNIGMKRKKRHVFLPCMSNVRHFNDQHIYNVLGGKIRRHTLGAGVAT